MKIIISKEQMDDSVIDVMNAILNPPPPLEGQALIEYNRRMRQLRIEECRDEIASLEEELERLLAESE
jgi:hypothetical protein